jgi:hypothetical protein
MSHKNQSPIEANGTHNKFEFTICSILESPLHCWPLNTMFLSEEITHKESKVNGKKMRKTKQAVLMLFLWGFMLLIHSEALGRDVQVNVTIRQRAAQPYLYIPATFFWDYSRINTHEDRLKRLKEKVKAKKKLKQEQLRRLEATKKKP